MSHGSGRAAADEVVPSSSLNGFYLAEKDAWVTNDGDDYHHSVDDVPSLVRRTPSAIEWQWHYHGNLHRAPERGPAHICIERSLGRTLHRVDRITRSYYVYDQLHRVDGPAQTIHLDGKLNYAVHMVYGFLHSFGDKPAIQCEGAMPLDLKRLLSVPLKEGDTPEAFFDPTDTSTSGLPRVFDWENSWYLFGMKFDSLEALEEKRQWWRDHDISLRFGVGPAEGDFVGLDVDCRFHAKMCVNGMEEYYWHGRRLDSRVEFDQLSALATADRDEETDSHEEFPLKGPLNGLVGHMKPVFDFDPRHVADEGEGAGEGAGAGEGEGGGEVEGEGGVRDDEIAIEAMDVETGVSFSVGEWFGIEVAEASVVGEGDGGKGLEWFHLEDWKRDMKSTAAGERFLRDSATNYDKMCFEPRRHSRWIDESVWDGTSVYATSLPMSEYARLLKEAKEYHWKKATLNETKVEPTVWPNGDIEFRNAKGTLHRIDGPALIRPAPGHGCVWVSYFVGGIGEIHEGDFDLLFRLYRHVLLGQTEELRKLSLPEHLCRSLKRTPMTIDVTQELNEHLVKKHLIHHVPLGLVSKFARAHGIRWFYVHSPSDYVPVDRMGNTHSPFWEIASHSPLSPPVRMWHGASVGPDVAAPSYDLTLSAAVLELSPHL